MHTNQKVSQQLQRAAHTTKILSIILTSESEFGSHAQWSRNMQLKGWGGHLGGAKHHPNGITPGAECRKI